MTQTTNNQPHPDDELFTYLDQLIYREFGHHLNTVEDKIKQQILKHFVPKEELNKVKMSDVVSPSPSPAAHKVIDEAMKHANDSQEQTIMYSDLAWCLGKLRGLGVPAEQLEAKYKLTNNQPNTPKGEGE